MNKLTLQEYLDKRIKDIEHYIQFNERKDDKDFFAHKELELYQMAQKYMQLSNQIGCPLDIVFKALSENCVYTVKDTNTDTQLSDNAEKCYKRVDSIHGFWGGQVWSLREFNAIVVRVKDYKKTWCLNEDLSE